MTFDHFDLPAFIPQGENSFYYYPGGIDEYINCRTHETTLLPQKLRDKYPQLNTLLAICDDGTEFDMVIMENKPELTGGQIKVVGDSYFRPFTFDKEINMFRVEHETHYQHRKEPQSMLGRFLKGAEEDEVDFFTQNNETPSELTTQPPFPGGPLPGKMTGNIFVTRSMYMFLYIDRNICNRYSNNAEILAAVTIMMNYLNGIYNRELGLYFRIPDVQDQLFCSQENNCNHQTHSSKLDLLVRLRTYLDDLVPNSNAQKINVFHGIGNFAGGVAYTPSFCVITYGGVSGAKYHDISTKTFVVNLLAHEVGHQLNMRHSFRDCYGDQALTLSVEDAIEPGSGNSIMSYAGFCPDGKNIESSAYPYFTAVSIHRSRNTLNNLYDGGCGDVIELTENTPYVENMTDYCHLPLGGKFGLSANVTNGTYFSWELNNTGFLPYGNVNSDEPIMQSYFPSIYNDRWVPNFYNLFYSTFNDYKATEYIPMHTEQEAFVLLMTRTQFSLSSDPLSTYNPYNSGMVLQNSSKLIWHNKAKLEIQSFTVHNSTKPYLLQNNTIDITWNTGDSLGDEIEILFGKRPKTWNQHEPHLFRPDFVKLHQGPNDGAETIDLLINDTDVYRGMFIIRTTDDPFCFHWDGVGKDVNGVVDAPSETSNLPLIIGLSVGGVVILLTIIFFTYRKMKTSGYVSIRY